MRRVRTGAQVLSVAWRRSSLAGLCLVLAIGTPAGIAQPGTDAPPLPIRDAWSVTRRYPAPEARQAVAVDATHFYVIDNRRIGKYEKSSGTKVGAWQGPEGGPFIHLNSGVVIDGRLYCAHSNYPGVPMVSSIEVWDTGTLRHVQSIPVGTGRGSATWIDRRDNAWWVMFAHYRAPNGEPGKGPEYSVLVRYDTEWRETGTWAFPKAVVARWDGMSSSGGVWTRDGRLITTGHHAPELHVLRLPTAGATLLLEGIVPVESEGQGIALDPSDPTRLWSIQRRTGEVLVSTMR